MNASSFSHTLSDKWKFLLWSLLLLLWSGVLAYMVFKVSRNVFPDLFRPYIVFICLFGAINPLHHLAGKISRLITRLYAVLLMLLTGTVIIFFIFYRSQRRGITFEDIYALLQSDSAEITFYALNYFFSTKSLLFCIAGIACTLALIVSGKKLTKNHFPLRFKPAFVSLILLCVGIGFGTQLYPIKLSIKVRNQYHADISNFQSLIRQISATPKTDATKQERGELYVIVIGESQSRDFMSGYSGAIAQNTPWLETIKNNNAWFIFPNAYSSNTHTTPVITAALTDGRHLSGLTFPKGITLLQTLKDAGIRTHWLSNQAAQGPWDNPISALAYQADTVRYINEKMHSFSLAAPKPDACLIPFFTEILQQCDPKDNTFIVVHLMGNHAPYSARYPDDFPRMPSVSKGEIGKQIRNPKRVDAFEKHLTSIAYTDSVLQELHQVIKEEQRPTVFLYFADHGEDIFSRDGGHDFSNFTWHKARIPMGIWFSEAYQDRYPDRIATLRKHIAKIFTNDLLFDLILGLANIKSSVVNNAYDLSQLNYFVTVENAVIASGKKISDDPFLNVQRNVASGAGKHFALHRANTVFKANQAFRLGITGLEIDLLFLEHNGKTQLWLGHEEASMTGLTLREYLTALLRKPDFLWLDIKNITPENKERIRNELSELDKHFSLKDIALVESSNVSTLDFFSNDGWRVSYYLPWNAIQDSVKNGDNTVVQKLAGQVKRYNIPAVSFDLAGEYEIKENLLPILPQNTVLYGRSFKSSWSDHEMPQKIASHPQYEKILTPLKTAYDY